MLDPRNYQDDNNEDDDYLDDGIEIHSEVFNKDFDEVGFDPEIDDDSDIDAAKKFGY